MPPKFSNSLIFPGKQLGAVLMLLVLVLFVGGSAVLLSALNNNDVSIRRDEKTTIAMQKAKEAIIAYAVLHGDNYGLLGAGPGHLFCPDFNNDGLEDAPCPLNAVGRLPRSITLPSGEIFHITDHASGIDQQLWYAVSSEFRRSPSGILSPLLAALPGTFTVDGRSGYAAVIIAPGDAVGPQSRPNNAATNYLEASNVLGLNFVTNNPLDPVNFNDRILPITTIEIITPVAVRMAETVKVQLDAFHGLLGRYPDHINPLEFPAAMATAPLWFVSNLWLLNSNYTQTTLDEARVQFNGCNITFTVAFVTVEIGRDLLRC